MVLGSSLIGSLAVLTDPQVLWNLIRLVIAA